MHLLIASLEMKGVNHTTENETKKKKSWIFYRMLLVTLHVS